MLHDPDRSTTYLSRTTTRTYRILHMSDIHITADGHDAEGVDADASLRQMLQDLEGVEALDGIVVSGDLADDGSIDAYSVVLERIGAFAGDRGIPQIYAMGNHDDRVNFQTVLGSGHLSSAGRDIGTARDGQERAAVSHIGGLRVVTLDSLVPGDVYGQLTQHQLSWLSSVLATPAPDGSIVVLHHPPLDLPTHPLGPTVLRNRDELGEVLAGSDVLVVLCGHLHMQIAGSLAGVPVVASPGVVTRIDLTAPWHLLRGVLGAGATIVDLGGPSSPVSYVLHARDPEAGSQVYLYDIPEQRFLEKRYHG